MANDLDGIEFRVKCEGGMSWWPPFWDEKLPPLVKKGEGIDAVWFATLNIEGLRLLSEMFEDGIKINCRQGQHTIKILDGGLEPLLD